MQVRRYSDPFSFLNRAESFLMRGEAENNMMLGIRGLPGSRPIRFGEDCYLATVEDGDEIMACALRTPPFGVIITRAERPALDCLAKDLAAKYDTLSAVLGPEPAVSIFAQLWSQRAGTPTRPLMRMRLFVAHEVRVPPVQPP